MPALLARQTRDPRVARFRSAQGRRSGHGGPTPERRVRPGFAHEWPGHWRWQRAPGLLAGKSTQQVGPADDSDNPVVASHRHTLDAMSFHQPRNLIDRRFFRDRHYLSCHHLLDLATMGMDSGVTILASTIRPSTNWMTRSTSSIMR